MIQNKTNQTLKLKDGRTLGFAEYGDPQGKSTMKEVKQKLTLDRPATYQVRVPGHLDESWSDWAGGMTIMVERGGDGPPVTTLTGILDQAALQGLLRRLYSLGLPVISVHYVECDSEDGR